MHANFPLWCAAFLVVAVPAIAQDAARVRGLDDEARRLLAMAQQRSPTVGALVAELEGSDVIVLVQNQPPPAADLGRECHGSTRLVGSAHQQRYVAIWIDSLWNGVGHRRNRISLLAHELQHAVEIARAPWVVDVSGMFALFSQIGLEHSYNRFETEAALAVESIVWDELAYAAAAAGKKARAVRHTRQ